MKNNNLLNKIKENKFLIIGRAGVDIYPDPPGTKIENATSFVTHLGGSSANIAVALTKLGGNCKILTSVSDDALGRLAINQLKFYNIDTFADKKNIGVWYKDENTSKKVAAIGVRVSKWIAYHGFSLNINNKLVQNGNSSLMLWKIDEIISHVSKFFTLKIGDLIFTGTPSGVSRVKKEDILEGYIEGVECFKIKIK